MSRLVVWSFNGEAHISLEHLPGGKDRIGYAIREIDLYSQEAELPLSTLKSLLFSGWFDGQPIRLHAATARRIVKQE